MRGEGNNSSWEEVVRLTGARAEGRSAKIQTGVEEEGEQQNSL